MGRGEHDVCARRSAAKEGGKRPSIERSTHPDAGVSTETLEVATNTGWRYARVSGDFNPIHLTARTAQMFGFKQAVAHGMWSLGRCLAAAAPSMPTNGVQIDTQFKLPVYIPSQALARTWAVQDGVDISHVHAARRSLASVHAGTKDFMMDLLTAIENRASALKLSEPGPSREHIEQIAPRRRPRARSRPSAALEIRRAGRRGASQKLGDAMANVLQRKASAGDARTAGC